MKSLYKRIAFLGIIIIALQSCKKDPVNQGTQPPPTTDPQPAAAKIVLYRNGEDDIRFQYDANGRVTQVKIDNSLNTNHYAITYTIAYTGDNKIASLTSDGGQKIIPIYANGRIERADLFEGNNREGYTNYSYDDGVLRSMKVYAGVDANVHLIFSFEVRADAKGNFTTLESFKTTGTSDVLVRTGLNLMTYDNKSNPLKPLAEILQLFWQPTSKNNIVSDDHYDDNQKLIDHFEYTYTYYNNNFPRSGTVIQGVPTKPQTHRTVEFSYQ